MAKNVTKVNWRRYRRQRGWIPENVDAAQHQLCNYSLHVSNDDIFRLHLLTSAILFRELNSFYGSRSSARLRWWKHRKKQRTMDFIVNSIAPKRDHVIGFGTGFFGFGRTRKHTQGGPSPVKSVRRNLALKRRVVLVNEFHTTRNCSICGAIGIESELQEVERLMTIIEYPNPILPNDPHLSRLEKRNLPHVLKVVTSRGLKHCPQCNSLRSRDANAAENILQVLRSENETGERPLHLRRPIQVVAEDEE